MTKPQKIPFIGKLVAHRHQLSNGLKIIFVPTKVAPVFSYQTWYDVGSRDEKPLYSGMAHLFEHMMFKETKNLKLGVFDKTMESHGARDLNAFTSTDYTAYVQSLPKQYLDLVASLESERMTNLALTEDQFVSEREVVRNERKQRTDNNPDGQMHEELQRLAFTSHPYGRPVIGWEEDLDRMTTTDCHNFYKSFYAPNNAVIVVVGDHAPDFVFKTIEKNYGGIARSDLQRTPMIVEPDQTAERTKEMQLGIQVEKVYVAYKIPCAIHDDQVALSALSAVLTSGRSSRLYQAIVDTGLGMDVSAGSGAGKDPSLFYVSFSAQTGKKIRDGLAALDKVLDVLSSFPVSDIELKRAKNKIRTEFFLGLGSNSARANFIGHNEIVLGDFKRGLEEMEALKNLDAKEIMRVCREYFRPQKRTMVIGLPQ